MSLAPYDNLERREIANVQSGEWRIVSAKRARKLRRRGERVWWSYGVQALVWSPWWARKDGITLMNPLPPNVELALAELAARRARDAEVEALVKAAKDAARDIHLVLSIDGQELELGSLRKLSSAERNLRTTLSAFTGDKT